MKKRILVLTNYFSPGVKAGGPIQSVKNMVDNLSDKIDFYIITSDRDSGEDNPYPDIKTDEWVQVGNSKVFYTNAKAISLKRLAKLINSISYDVLYLNSYLNYKYSILPVVLNRFGRIPNKPILIAPRGELFPNALKQKSYKKRPYLIWAKHYFLTGNITFQATSLEEGKCIQKELSISEKRIYVVENIPSLPKKIAIKSKKEKGRLNLVYIARIHPTKNLLFALECLKHITGTVSFDVYGYIDDALYWEKCKLMSESLHKNISINYYGIAERKDIHYIFSKHDALLLPTLTENYGHSIVEAMLSDCPVIISDNTPWTGINDASAGWALSLFNQANYIDAIQCLIDMDNDQYIELLRNNETYIHNKLRTNDVISRYVEMFYRLI